MPERDSPALGPRGRPWALAALILAALHFAGFQILLRPLLTDVRYYLYFAWRVGEGDTPHLDLFDPKTQLATLIGAALFRAGEALGLEPIHAVRAGYLGLATLGAWSVHFVHRRLGGHHLAGLLGVLAVCSFPLLGDLPANGNLPKLGMTLMAPLAALCAWRGRWTLAGALGAWAFLDWQIGAVLGLGVAATAALVAKNRARVVLRVALGGVLGLAPFVLYFALRGGLAEALDQTLVSAFFRGSNSARDWSLAGQLRDIRDTCIAGAGGRAWLMWASLAGIPLAALQLRRVWSTSQRALLLPLLVYHAGVLGFSVLDFQSKGDAFVVLHSLAFFQALVWAELWRRARGLAAPVEGVRQRVLAGGLVALALVATRPHPLPGDPAPTWRGLRLEGQRELARRLAEETEGRHLAAVEKSELMLLMRRRNPLPFIYWNAAAWASYRRDAEEDAAQTLRRILDEERIDALLLEDTKRMRDFGPGDLGPGWTRRRVEAGDGRHFVTLFTR